MLSGSYWNYNAAHAIDRVENRVDAEFGLGALLLGFLLQAIGYGEVLFGADVTVGCTRGVVAMMLAVAAATVVLLWRRVKPKRALALLPAVALAQGKEPAGWNQERAGFLLACGRRLGHEPDEGEGKVAYARRGFNVELPDDCD